MTFRRSAAKERAFGKETSDGGSSSLTFDERRIKSMRSRPDGQDVQPYTLLIDSRPRAVSYFTQEVEWHHLDECSADQRFHQRDQRSTIRVGPEHGDTTMVMATGGPPSGGGVFNTIAAHDLFALNPGRIERPVNQADWKSFNLMASSCLCELRRRTTCLLTSVRFTSAAWTLDILRVSSCYYRLLPWITSAGSSRGITAPTRGGSLRLWTERAL